MSRIWIALLLVSAVLCEEATIEKYVSACPGAVAKEDSTYSKFLRDTFAEDGNLMSNCEIEYFSNVTSIASNGCTEEHNKCVKSVQEFMWNGCHWRLLYDISNSRAELINWIDAKYAERKDFIVQFFTTMKEDDSVYTFASTCGSWDWVGILIMICSAFFGSYACLWIIGGIMKCSKKSPEKAEKAE